MRGWRTTGRGCTGCLESSGNVCAEVGSCALSGTVGILWSACWSCDFFNSLPPVAGTGKACAHLSWKWPQFNTSGYLYGWGSVWPRCYWLHARMLRPVSNLPHTLLTWQSRWRDTLYISKNSFSQVIFIMAFEYDIQMIFHASVDSVSLKMQKSEQFNSLVNDHVDYFMQFRWNISVAHKCHYRKKCCVS